MIRHEHETPRSHCDSHLAARVEDAAERQVVERGKNSVFSMIPYAQVSCRGDADGGEETTEDVWCMELFDAIKTDALDRGLTIETSMFLYATEAVLAGGLDKSIALKQGNIVKGTQRVTLGLLIMAPTATGKTRSVNPMLCRLKEVASRTGFSVVVQSKKRGSRDESQDEEQDDDGGGGGEKELRITQGTTGPALVDMAEKHARILYISDEASHTIENLGKDIKLGENLIHGLDGTSMENNNARTSGLGTCDFGLVLAISPCEAAGTGPVRISTRGWRRRITFPTRVGRRRVKQARIQM